VGLNHAERLFAIPRTPFCDSAHQFAVWSGRGSRTRNSVLFDVDPSGESVLCTKASQKAIVETINMRFRGAQRSGVNTHFYLVLLAASTAKNRRTMATITGVL
jgi:hypothetical protein